MFWRRFLYLVLLLGIYTFYLFYEMWFAWYCLILVIILPIFSGILSLVFLYTLKIKPEITRVALINEEAYFDLAPKKKSLAGILNIFVVCKIKDYMAGSEKQVKLSAPLNSEHHYVIDTTHCGVYEFTVAKVYIYDFLGIFRFLRKVDFSSKIMVKPIPVMPERMPDAAGFKAKYLRKSSSSDSGIYDIKEYTEGDSVKNIHWKISAKKGKVFVKEPQEEYNAHSRLYLELNEDRALMDRWLGEVVFTSKYFLSKDIQHTIRVIPPYNKEISFCIESTHDIDKMLMRVLTTDLSSVKSESEDEENE